MGLVKVSLVFTLLTAPCMELLPVLLSGSATALRSLADAMAALKLSFERGA